MKTVTKKSWAFSDAFVVIGLLGFIFGFFSLIFFISASHRRESEGLPAGAKVVANVYIADGSPVPVEVPVYLVEIQGHPYYATESGPRAYTLCPVTK